MSRKLDTDYPGLSFDHNVKHAQPLLDQLEVGVVGREEGRQVWRLLLVAGELLGQQGVLGILRLDCFTFFGIGRWRSCRRRRGKVATRRCIGGVSTAGDRVLGEVHLA